MLDVTTIDYRSLSAVTAAQNTLLSQLGSGQLEAAEITALDYFYTRAAATLGVSGSGTTVLYSGSLDTGAHTNTAATSLNATIDGLRIVDATNAGLFFGSEATQATLYSLFARGLTINGVADINVAVYGGTTGSIWGTISSRFTSGARGDIYAIVPNASADRVFALVELEEALTNPNITSINGISTASLRAMGISAAFDAVKAGYTNGLSYLFAEAYTEGRITRAEFDDLFNDAGITTTDNHFRQMAIDGVDYANSNGISLNDFGGFSRAFSALEKVGVAGDLIATAVVATEVVRLYNAGDIEQANAMLQEFGAGMIGGAVGGYSGAIIALAIVGIFVPEPSSTAAGVAVLLGAIGGGMAGEAIAVEVLDLIRDKLSSGQPLTEEDLINLVNTSDEFCFAAGTLVDMADGSHKAIERIVPGDQVMSFDAMGHLTPGRVARVFVNRVTQLLDFHGTRVTPGHAYLCGDGPLAGTYATLIDVLRSDGAVVDRSGQLIRAATGDHVGSPSDVTRLWVAVGRLGADGTLHPTDARQVRAGTKVALPGGRAVSLTQLVAAAGAEITPAGLVRGPDGRESLFHWTFGTPLPRPEDYILARSRITLSDIYDAAEWQEHRPLLPAPATFRRPSGPEQLQ